MGAVMSDQTGEVTGNLDVCLAIEFRVQLLSGRVTTSETGSISPLSLTASLFPHASLLSLSHCYSPLSFPPSFPSPLSLPSTLYFSLSL